MGAPRIVTLSNSSLMGLLKRPDVLQAFPQLRGISKQLNKTKGCRCQAAKAKAKSKAMNDLKNAIKDWPESNKTKLKKLLNADRVKAYVGKQAIEF